VAKKVECVKVQCSILASALGSLTESPLRALQGNCDTPITFWTVSARGVSPVPALCKFSCTQPSGDPLQDVKNYFDYVASHTWSFTDAGSGNHYQQTDTIDAGTLQAASAVVDDQTPPDWYTLGAPTLWNDGNGYTYGAAGFTSASGADWSKAGTRTGILAALDAINWSALWAGTPLTPSDYLYDRASIAPDAQGELPFGPQGKTGNLLVNGYNAFGPTLALTGITGQISPGGTTDELGVSLARTQIQIRNFRGAVIPYFIYESCDVATAVQVLGTNTIREPSSTTLTSGGTYYRKVSEGEWNADLQIIQLPDGAMDGPQEVTAPHAAAVRNGTAIGIVMGMTFEEWMEGNLGPTWADYVFG
jgi:hypothetical protein